MTSPIWNLMENQVRIFRKNPIAWWDKNAMRHLRHKYGKDKKTFLNIRSVYLALCEIESDFADCAVNSFTKTVGAYAGLSRETAGRYINKLVEEGLISKVRVRDERTKKYLTGTMIEILDFQSVTTASEPVSGYPSNGLPQRWDTQAPIKKVSRSKKISTNKNNVASAQGRSRDEAAYFAQKIAVKLQDEKSISFYTLACMKHDPSRLLRKAHEIIADGGARNPGAVFVQWLQGLDKSDETGERGVVAHA